MIDKIDSEDIIKKLQLTKLTPVKEFLSYVATEVFQQ
jgi:hypothetical protein